ncbi:MAG TPA: hypothetical protein EYP98_06000, partial [Planctomycetes bacterium]|nr:hypothetical protein [Planctomycetota bacterium]
MKAKAKRAKAKGAKAKGAKKAKAKKTARADETPSRRRKKPVAVAEDLSDVTFPSSDEPSPHGDPFQDRATQTE